MRPRAAAGLVTAALIGLWASDASATLSEALSLADLVRDADHVVVVTCVDEHALRDGRGRIVTDYRVTVEDVMGGSAAPGDSLTVRRLGGELGDLGMTIAGEPRLEVGQRYLLFLRDASSVLRPVGMSQGVLPVREREGVPWAHPGGAGLSLVQRGPGGQLVPAPAALLRPEPLEALRERIEAVAP